ncbi:hypothetical protein ND748_25865 [Frankia sp. AiPs1]|uniref:hypothetical protein n=1 Tax=Frankia sp. AiPs1 TaxID=573493 RepID=UPI0020444099|nr:hypothetical protein [Frankia sp. AiPs1]MCM3925080.1 hypothetical protein [Frankia sp. AiPs1]
MDVDGAGADYREVFEAATRPAAEGAGARDAGVRDAGARDAEGWIRAVLEGAPAPVRWFLRAGWQFGLGLRLGPVSSPRHVLGWPIVAREPNVVRLATDSPLVSAELVLRVRPAAISLTTSVTFTRRAARLLWTAALPLHRLSVPRLLRRAVAASPAP